ncbi:hypothetical protein BST61_g10302 [Cercospora zeina]
MAAHRFGHSEPLTRALPSPPLASLRLIRPQPASLHRHKHKNAKSQLSILHVKNKRHASSAADRVTHVAQLEPAVNERFRHHLPLCCLDFTLYLFTRHPLPSTSIGMDRRSDGSGSCQSVSPPAFTSSSQGYDLLTLLPHSSVSRTSHGALIEVASGFPSPIVLFVKTTSRRSALAPRRPPHISMTECTRQEAVIRILSLIIAALRPEPRHTPPRHHNPARLVHTRLLSHCFDDPSCSTVKSLRSWTWMSITARNTRQLMRYTAVNNMPTVHAVDYSISEASFSVGYYDDGELKYLRVYPFKGKGHVGSPQCADNTTREMGAPRVPGNATVNWQQRKAIEAWSLENFWESRSNDAGIMMRSHYIPGIEFTDDQGVEAIGQDLIDLVDDEDAQVDSNEDLLSSSAPPTSHRSD